MNTYDLNVTATQIIRVEAETEGEAIDKAFYEAFKNTQRHFASTEYEIVSVEDIG